MKKNYTKPDFDDVIGNSNIIVMSGEWVNDPYGDDWWVTGGDSL